MNDLSTERKKENLGELDAQLITQRRERFICTSCDIRRGKQFTQGTELTNILYTL